MREVPLGNVVDLVMGQAPPSKTCNFDGNGTPFVKVGEFGPMRPVIREWTTQPLKLARASDVLLCVVGATCGKINLGADCAIGRSVAAMRPKPDVLSQQYLYYFLSTLVLILRSGSQGAAQTVISKEMIRAVEIPLPPLPEQQRIVAILDEAFAGLATAAANAEKNLNNARELFDSYLKSVFAQLAKECEVGTLRCLCDLISGQHIDAKDYNTRGAGIGYLTGPSDFGPMHPTVSKWTEVPKRIAKKGDILITVKGSGVGSINLLDTGEVAISRQLMAARPKGMNRDLLFYFLSLQQSHFQALANGAAIPGISREDVLGLPIATPVRAVQDKLVAAIKEVEAQVRRLEDHYKSRVAHVAELKQSLLQKAFSGELTSPPTRDVKEAAE